MIQIPRQPIASSAIASVGHCPAQAILDIEFRRDRTVYRYFDVPAELSRQLVGASSVGGFFHTRIRDQFRCVRLDP